MIKRLAGVLPYFLLVPAVLPLVYVDGLLYPYLTPKTLLFRADFLLAIAAFVVLVLAGREFYFSRLNNKLSWIPGVLLVVAYVTSLFGTDFYHSFWSIFDRGDGLLTFTATVSFFYLLLLTANERFIERFFKVVACVATCIAAFAFFQWVQIGTGMDIPLIPDPQGRIGSTLGNAAFLAGYLGLSFFVTLIAASLVRDKWRTAAYIGAGLQLFAIVVSATRGTLLALGVAGLVALVYAAWRGEGQVRTYARGGFVAFLIVAALFFVFRSQLAQVPFEPVRRIASISTSDATVESRLFIWKEVGSESLKTPLLGTGAEHISVLFNRVYDPTAIVEQWFDRTHNAFLDYFVQYGIVGFLLYIGLIVAFAREAFRQARTESDLFSHGALFALLILVYAVQNFFVFDTAATFWLLLALFATLLAVRGESVKTALPIPRLPSVVPIAAGTLIAILVIPVSLTPLRANLLLADGYLYHVFDVRRAIDSMEKGYALGSYADIEYGYQLYEMYTERQIVMLSGEARLNAYRFAEKVLSENYENYPYDARTVTYYAHVLDSAPPEVAINEVRLREVIDHAIILSPKRIQPHYLLANIAIRAGDEQPVGSAERERFYREGIAALEAYAQLVPKLAEPRFVLATIYPLIGDDESAARWAAEALPLYEQDLAVARRASRYYIGVEDWENARRFLADIVALSPQEYNVKYDLAKAEFLSGNVERAKQLVEELKTEAPGLVEEDPNFMAALEQ